MSNLYLYKKELNKGCDFNMWFVFPGPESFALSSLGYLWLYRELDLRSDVNIEMINTDTKTTEIMKSKVNLIAFSVSFDMDFLNILKILEKNKIEFKSSQRKETDPLIYAGGPVITANPKPYNEIFDFMVIGDGEAGVNNEIVNICINNKNKSKQEILNLLSKIEGVYVPNSTASVKKVTKKLPKCIYTPILSEKSFFDNTFIVEIERGCANRCAFCLASYINLPIRFPEYDNIIDTLEQGLKHTNKIALLGAQVTAHPKFKDIINYIDNKIKNGEKIEMSISSLRVDSFKKDIVQALVNAGQKNLTLAIEAGSERLRKVINKNLSKEQIFKAVKVACECGLHGIKFYAMLGLPTETMNDIEEIINLARIIKKEYKGIEISFAFSTFVPKANTPFQWFGRENEKSLEKKSNLLKKELHKLGIQITVSSPKWGYWQAVLSRGDEKLSDFMITVYKNGGKLGAFKKAAKELKIDTDYYAINNYNYEKTLPWDFIDINPHKEFLIKESKRLIQEHNLNTQDWPNSQNN